MKKGEIAYQGCCAKSVDFFAKAGYPCPELTNPADHLLDVVCIGADDEQNVLGKQIVPLDMDFGSDTDPITARSQLNWFNQFYILLTKFSVEKARRWELLFANIIVTLLVATFVGCGAWNNLGTTQAGLAKRNPLLFFCVIHQGVVASLQGTYSFPQDRAIMLRERAAGTYCVSAYFCAKSLADMYIAFITPIAWTVIVYPLCQLNPDPNKALKFYCLNMLGALSCQSLSNMMSCVFVSIELSTVCLSFLMEIARLYSAFFVSPLFLSSTPSFESWKFADATSYMKWMYVGLCRNEYEGATFYCTAAELKAGGGTCPVLTGEKFMAKMGYLSYDTSNCMAMLFCYIVVVRFIGYLGLRFIKV